MAQRERERVRERERRKLKPHPVQKIPRRKIIVKRFCFDYFVIEPIFEKQQRSFILASKSNLPAMKFKWITKAERKYWMTKI